ncbi:MAG: thioesterase [Clostridia bacterium]|nr:thioesterase [Clostridia bacterium]
MEDMYEREMVVRYTDIDRYGRLAVMEVPMITQDMLTEYYGTLGADNGTMKEKSNAAWVITKMKIAFGKLPVWMGRMTVSAYTIRKDGIRMVIEIKATDEDGNMVFTGDFETCAIDLTARRIRRINTTCLQENVHIYDGNPSFDKLPQDFEDTDFVTRTAVNWYDIDFTRHTNNTRYIDYMLRTLDPAYLTAKRISSLDVNFIKESREGDTLSIYRIQEGDTASFQIRKDGTEMLRARFCFTDETDE